MDQLPQPNPPQLEPSPVLKWGMRIFITLFTLPFFAVGFSLIFGFSLIGSQAGMPRAFGAFGVLFGLAFVAVPSLMLLAIWTSKFKPAAQPSAIQQTVEPPQPLQTCTYCGRPRPQSELACPTCGGH